MALVKIKAYVNGIYIKAFGITRVGALHQGLLEVAAWGPMSSIISFVRGLPRATVLGWGAMPTRASCQGFCAGPCQERGGRERDRQRETKRERIGREREREREAK